MTFSQSKTSVTPAELQHLAQAGTVDILDVRSPAEFESTHIPGAVLVPLDKVDAAAFLKARGDRSKPIYVAGQNALEPGAR
jgi:rhodanese-related sulfurtransferase